MSISIAVKNYLAVESADINIAGITVLSGINGCGKSSIARSLYEVLNGALNFDIHAEEFVSRNLAVLAQSIATAANNLSGIMPRNEANNIVAKCVFIFGKKTFEEKKNVVNEALDGLLKWAESYEKAIPALRTAFFRSAISVLSAAVGDTQPKDESMASFVVLLHRAKDKVAEIEANVVETIASRSNTVFQSVWKRHNGNKGLETKKFNVMENGVPICDTERNIVGLPDSIKRVFYIDSPMAFNETESSRSYWNDLNKYLKREPITDDFEVEDSDGSSGILNGSFKWDEKRNDIVYTQPDGISFDLSKNGATGLKSFVIIRNLYMNGLVDEKTLLIMDEPEAHLHPQWIVRFARFLVLLRKKTKCRLFVSSHSTDMVSSLKYISEKELCESPDFYIAEQDDPYRFVYSFKFIKDDIEPIFEAFNKSFKLEDSFSAGGDDCGKI